MLVRLMLSWLSTSQSPDSIKMRLIEFVQMIHIHIYDSLPRQTGGVPLIWLQTGETHRLLSSQIDCWVNFMLVQMSHSGSVKLQIHPPRRLGMFHLYGGRPVKIVLSHPKLTSESYCVLVQMSHPHPVELHVPPIHKLPLFHDPAGRPVALLFPNYNLPKKYFVHVQMRHHLYWYLPYYEKFSGKQSNHLGDVNHANREPKWIVLVFKMVQIHGHNHASANRSYYYSHYLSITSWLFNYHTENLTSHHFLTRSIL